MTTQMTEEWHLHTVEEFDFDELKCIEVDEELLKAIENNEFSV